jgi:hypothetical protein
VAVQVVMVAVQQVVIMPVVLAVAVAEVAQGEMVVLAELVVQVVRVMTTNKQELPYQLYS